MKILKMAAVLMGVSFGAMAGEVENLNLILKKIEEKNPLKDLKSINLIDSRSKPVMKKITIEERKIFGKKHERELVFTVLIKINRYSVADTNCQHIASIEESQEIPGYIAGVKTVVIEKSSCKAQPIPNRVSFCITKDSIRGGSETKDLSYEQCYAKAKDFLMSAKPEAKVQDALLTNYRNDGTIVVLKGREALVPAKPTK